MKLKRIIAFITMLAMLAGLSTVFFACSKSSPTVAEIGGVEISYNMLRYFAKNYMGDATAADYEGNEAMQQELADNVYATLRQLVACQKVADEQELELTDEEEEGIDSQIESMKSSFDSEDAYEEAIAAQFGDEGVLRRILELTLLQDKLYDRLTDQYQGIIRSDDPTVRADIEAGNFFAAEYLFIYYSDNDRAEKLEFAEGLHDRIANGELMADIDREYETTYGLKMDYCLLPCFTYTEELQYFEDAVLALDEGELSEMIERNNGVLIVKRLALDEGYINENFMSVVDSYIAREYTQYMQEYADGLSFEWESDYESLRIWEME